jgi:hypothetical protein
MTMHDYLGKRARFTKTGGPTFKFSSTLANVGIDWDVELDSGYDQLMIVSGPQFLQRERYDNHSIAVIEVKDTQNNATCWVLKEDLTLLDE